MKLLLERVPPRKGGAEGAKRVLGTLDLPRNVRKKCREIRLGMKF